MLEIIALELLYNLVGSGAAASRVGVKDRIILCSVYALLKTRFVTGKQVSLS